MLHDILYTNIDPNIWKYKKKDMHYCIYKFNITVFEFMHFEAGLCKKKVPQHDVFHPKWS